MSRPERSNISALDPVVGTIKGKGITMQNIHHDAKTDDAQRYRIEEHSDVALVFGACPIQVLVRYPEKWSSGIHDTNLARMAEATFAVGTVEGLKRYD